jgi:hypothetical protein
MRRRSRARRAFIVAEIALLAAIPVLTYAGFRTLLDTRTGTFVREPGPGEPGWQALVDPSPITGVVEVGASGVTGVTLIAGVGQTSRGGTVILVPGQLVVDGRPIGLLSPESAVEAVGTSLRLRIPTVEVVDAARWADLLAGTSYLLDNPDPVPDETGEVVFGVGVVEVTGARAALFLGQTSDGIDPLAALVRRELFWSELLANPPPAAEDPLSRKLHAVADGLHEVAHLPVERSASGSPVASPDRVEALVQRVIPFPAASAEGERIRLRIEDRTGNADLDLAARALAGLGMEIVAISNAGIFDSDVSALRVPPDTDGVERSELAERFVGLEIRSDPSIEPNDPMVLQLGPDHLDLLAALG